MQWLCQLREARFYWALSARKNFFLHRIEADCPFVERSSRKTCGDQAGAFASRLAPTGDLCRSQNPCGSELAREWRDAVQL
jgi:hypothetical protein